MAVRSFASLLYVTLHATVYYGLQQPSQLHMYQLYSIQFMYFFTFNILERSHTLQHFIEIHLMSVELRTIYANEFRLASTVIRHAPHIPVPSTMIVLSDTSVGISYFLVSRQTNFIMIAGPMAKHLSTFSRLITSYNYLVTKPFLPYEPSSVIIITSSELSLISFSKMISSLERPANTVMTRFPAAFRA